MTLKTMTLKMDYLLIKQKVLFYFTCLLWENEKTVFLINKSDYNKSAKKAKHFFSFNQSCYSQRIASL